MKRQNYPVPQTHNYGIPNRLVWQNEYNIPLQIQSLPYPNSNLNNRTSTGGPFRAEYNPYFWENYINRQMY